MHKLLFRVFRLLTYIIIVRIIGIHWFYCISEEFKTYTEHYSWLEKIQSCSLCKYWVILTELLKLKADELKRSSDSYIWWIEEIIEFLDLMNWRDRQILRSDELKRSSDS